MRGAGAVLGAVALLAARAPAQDAAGPAAPKNASHPASLAPVVERKLGIGLPPIEVRRGEVLTYEVEIELGPVHATVGKVSMLAGAEPYREGILLSPGPADAGTVTWLRAHALGEYKVYTMDAMIEARHLPTAWPSTIYRYTHSGTENRRRVISIGVKDEVPHASYRADTSKGAPRGTRVWREPYEREIPEGVLDMMTAIWLMRSMVQREIQRLDFPVLDKLHLWDVTLLQGVDGFVETEAGRFQVREVRLLTEPHPGEPAEDEEESKFEGIFGIEGDIRIWAERHSGVPVQVSGNVPAGPFQLGAVIRLVGYEGTPDEFLTVEQRTERGLLGHSR